MYVQTGGEFEGKQARQTSTTGLHLHVDSQEKEHFTEMEWNEGGGSDSTQSKAERGQHDPRVLPKCRVRAAPLDMETAGGGTGSLLCDTLRGQRRQTPTEGNPARTEAGALGTATFKP